MYSKRQPVLQAETSRATRVFGLFSWVLASVLVLLVAYRNLWRSSHQMIGLDVLIEPVIRAAAIILSLVALGASLVGWRLRRRPRWLALLFSAASIAVGCWAFVASPRLAANDLVQAASNGNLAIVKRCLQQGVPIDAREAWGWYLAPTGNTALTAAAYSGHTAVVHYLLVQRARPSPDALVGAVARQHADIVRLLLARGANPNWHEPYTPSNDGPTVLCVAIQTNNTEVTRILLEAGARTDDPCRIPVTSLPMGTAAEFASLCGTAEIKQLVGTYAEKERREKIQR